jgi:hypothetical protein
MVESAEICRMHGPEDRAQCNDQRWPSHVQARPAIEPCRTEERGGHVYCCEHGHDYQSSEHACKNRHGPQGPHGAAQEWRHRPRHMRLPGPDCLVTCTLPEAVRELARRHQQLRDNPLVRASAAALQQLAAAPRCVGGTLGMIGVLHPWPRARHDHPQGHSLGPAGGWARDGRQGRPSRQDCLVPVKALSLVFRATFREALRKTPVFDRVPRAVWDRDGGVPGAPGGTGAQARQSLAPDLVRVALSPNRLLTREDGPVTCPYQASQTEHTKVCTRSAAECSRRFLPPGRPDHVVKVRDDGWLSPGTREALPTVRALRGAQSTPRPRAEPAADSTPATTAGRCPRCGRAMALVEALRPPHRSPGYGLGLTPCPLLQASTSSTSTASSGLRLGPRQGSRA